MILGAAVARRGERAESPSIERVRRGRRHAIQTWACFGVGLAILLAGLLVGPRVSQDQQQCMCIGNITVAGPFGFGLNCDSPDFMWLAREPRDLLAPENPRQARPGLVLLAALLERPLSVVLAPTGPVRHAGFAGDDPGRIAQAWRENLAPYLAYILLNVATLLLSFAVLRRVLERGREAVNAPQTVVVVAVGILLVANDVTKAFVWSPHTQMFNMLVPLLAAHGVLEVWRSRFLDRAVALRCGLGAGLGITAYPAFVIVPLCLTVVTMVLLVRRLRERGRVVANLALTLAVSAAPFLAYYILVRAVTGGFYQFEMAHEDQVVWMGRAWASGAGAFAADWLGRAWELLTAARAQALPLGALGTCVALAALCDRGARDGLRLALPVLWAGLLVGAVVLGFYTCVGLTVDRLAYPVLPALLAAAGAGAWDAVGRLSAGRRSVLAAGIAVVALAQVVWVILKDGPWS